MKAICMSRQWCGDREAYFMMLWKNMKINIISADTMNTREFDRFYVSQSYEDMVKFHHLSADVLPSENAPVIKLLLLWMGDPFGINRENNHFVYLEKVDADSLNLNDYSVVESPLVSNPFSDAPKRIQKKRLVQKPIIPTSIHKKEWINASIPGTIPTKMQLTKSQPKKKKASVKIQPSLFMNTKFFNYTVQIQQEDK